MVWVMYRIWHAENKVFEHKRVDSLADAKRENDRFLREIHEICNLPINPDSLPEVKTDHDVDSVCPQDNVMYALPDDDRGYIRFKLSTYMSVTIVAMRGEYTWDRRLRTADMEIV